MMLAKVAMHALDYDAKLTPSLVLTEITEEMHVQLDEATDNILGCNLEASQHRLVQQPGCFGGLRGRRLSRGLQLMQPRRRGTSMRRLSRSCQPSWGRPMTSVADTDLAEQARRRQERVSQNSQRLRHKCTRVRLGTTKKTFEEFWITVLRGTNRQRGSFPWFPPRHTRACCHTAWP